LRRLKHTRIDRCPDDRFEQLRNLVLAPLERRRHTTVQAAVTHRFGTYLGSWRGPADAAVLRVEELCKTIQLEVSVDVPLAAQRGHRGSPLPPKLPAGQPYVFATLDSDPIRSLYVDAREGFGLATPLWLFAVLLLPERWRQPLA